MFFVYFLVVQRKVFLSPIVKPQEINKDTSYSFSSGSSSESSSSSSLSLSSRSSSNQSNDSCIRKTIAELNRNCSKIPVWLKTAKTSNAVVSIKDLIGKNEVWAKDYVTWEGGTWEDGLWKNGKWLSGIWQSGTWKKGLWKTGLNKKKTTNPFDCSDPWSF